MSCIEINSNEVGFDARILIGLLKVWHRLDKADQEAIISEAAKYVDSRSASPMAKPEDESSIRRYIKRLTEPHTAK